ncbi:MAG: hypothetical protein L6R40_003590 [Gallowayella cf. fulva]|nr:MAG: hypothetical protein L6R40_003590 [Xanthomendoza cf. fulva]
MAASALAIPQSNGVIPFADPSDLEAWEISQYEKIIEIRDQVFAGTHPRLKLLSSVGQQIQDTITSSSRPSYNPQQAGSIIQPASNSQRPPSANASETQMPSSSVRSRIPHPFLPGVGASGIDPILLEKSDVLLRAEDQQMRQRIERVLADQVKEKQAASKQKVFDHDDLPEFNVTEVLRKAQELVKPVKFAVTSGANGNASTSDSFDENTFYSSQMNDSTPEPVEKLGGLQKAPRPQGEGQKAQVQPVKNDNADTQASSGARIAGQQPLSNDNTSNAFLSSAERIAKLEAELLALKGERPNEPVHAPVIDTTYPREAQEEESVYSPPDAVPPKSNEDSSGRKLNTRPQQRRMPENASRRESRPGKKFRTKAARERVGYEEEAQSQIADEGRVIRNHITSPLAPQPARVSPLAVAKAPPIQQTQHGQVPIHKKRKRELEGNSRNVVARREPASPEIRIKEEPTSPPPSFAEAADGWEPRRRGDDRGPIYVDEVSPRYQEQDRVIYRSNVIDRPAPRYVLDDYRETAPVMHEPDLRRMVSTRQARAPLTGNERYASPHPPPTRAISQMYIPRQEQALPREYRTSIQPEPGQNIDRDLAPSPRFREVSTMMMAPPPRRIVVDQHGNQFYEQEVAPLFRPRQSSMAPLHRQAPPDSPFPMPGPRHSVARIPQAAEGANETRYIRRAASPISPQYVEYTSPSNVRPPVDRDAGIYYSNEPPHRRGEGVRMIEYGPPPTNGRYEELRPMEGISRVSSVRPVGAHYEAGPERVGRVQSVLPEGRRVISLGGEMMAQGSRHMSIRPDDPSARPMEYAPRMQYYPGSDGRG